MFEVTPDSCDSPVTVVISRKVKRGKEAEFEAFLVGVNAACMKYDGHLGTNIFRPSSEADSEYRVIFKFDCLSKLRRWEESEERQQWFAQAETLTTPAPHSSFNRIGDMVYPSRTIHYHASTPLQDGVG